MIDPIEEVGLLYYLIEVPDTGAPNINVYETVQDLAARIQELDGTGVTVMPFCGRRLSISAGPFRYLLDRDDDPPIPLFDTPRTDNLTWEAQAHLGEVSPRESEFALGTPADITDPSDDEEAPVA
jgi:hypothetical protein